jgi:poly(A) polymerase
VQPRIYLPSEHTIDPQLIDREAIVVINKLKSAGYSAYLVGGSVRDLLAKKVPKDFDISTSARPEEIKSLFGRQCILIGRRFRLAHIRFGHKILEVSTFRAGDPAEGALITQDNQWGTEEEDVLRRDFTINGLYYDPNDQKVIDYVGGWEDINNRLLRTIGDPIVRFKQDPVRMIRLIKFRARLRYDIVSDTKIALLKCLPEILKSSPARVLEEMYKMLESGASAPFFQLMADSGLLNLLFPKINPYFENPDSEAYGFLIASDQINQKDLKRPLSRSTLTAAVLFPLIDQALQEKKNSGNVPHLGQIHSICYELIHQNLISAFSHFPRRILSEAAMMITHQYRMTPLQGKMHFSPRFLRSRDFADALLLLRIRAEANEELMDVFEEWRKHYQHLKKEGHHSKK